MTFSICVDMNEPSLVSRHIHLIKIGIISSSGCDNLSDLKGNTQTIEKYQTIHLRNEGKQPKIRCQVPLSVELLPVFPRLDDLASPPPCLSPLPPHCWSSHKSRCYPPALGHLPPPLAVRGDGGIEVLGQIFSFFLHNNSRKNAAYNLREEGEVGCSRVTFTLGARMSPFDTFSHLPRFV